METSLPRLAPSGTTSRSRPAGARPPGRRGRRRRFRCRRTGAPALLAGFGKRGRAQADGAGDVGALDADDGLDFGEFDLRGGAEFNGGFAAEYERASQVVEFFLLGG
jgi:hypothetical protein